MPFIAGMDGCSDGWVCVWQELKTRAIGARILHSVNEVLTLEHRPDLVAIDIPIGLPEAGSRFCDIEARKILGSPRCSSVFTPPIRPALNQPTYKDACDARYRVDGKKYPKQSFELFPKIREVDEFIRAEADRGDWLREVHPELCFALWNNGLAIKEGKRTPVGRKLRRDLVCATYGVAFEGVMASLKGAKYATDDVLDAFAALWSAERILSGIAKVIPADPQVDAHGLHMEMSA